MALSERDVEEERERRADDIRETRGKERCREIARRNARNQAADRTRDCVRQQQQRADHKEFLSDIKPFSGKTPAAISSKLRTAKPERRQLNPEIGVVSHGLLDRLAGVCGISRDTSEKTEGSARTGRSNDSPIPIRDDLGMVSPTTAVKQKLDDLAWTPRKTLPIALNTSEGW